MQRPAKESKSGEDMTRKRQNKDEMREQVPLTDEAGSWEAQEEGKERRKGKG